MVTIVSLDLSQMLDGFKLMDARTACRTELETFVYIYFEICLFTGVRGMVVDGMPNCHQSFRRLESLVGEIQDGSVLLAPLLYVHSAHE